MPTHEFTQTLQLPELKIISHRRTAKLDCEFELEKTSSFEICPKCATRSWTIYDHVWVRIKDAPIRDRHIFLKIKKRRFLCKKCKKPFTEPVAGIRKGFRTTERFRRHIMWCSDNFSNLSQVQRQLDISSSLNHKAYYEQLGLQIKTIQNEWATTIGIDEHAFRKNRKGGYREFATIFVEYSHKRVRELTLGRSPGELFSSERLMAIPGRENVKNVIIDLSKTYHRFARDFFPNAKIIADRFHVMRLFNNIVNIYRKNITGDKRKNPIRKLLLKRSADLDPHVRRAIDRWLGENPAVREVYQYKEAMHRLYRIKGMKHARRVLIKLTDQMALSNIPEINVHFKT
ncbi:MAG: ISL3 family transposase [Bacteriovoracaceae bacterium]|nr:ISL3 family transposase [Bacteriovoracaceae bacterium]